jgi:hypothetical protein
VAEAIAAARPKTAEELGEEWFAAMRRGDFAAAWRASDAILRLHAGVPCWHLPRHEQYVWNGTPLDGKRVLVRCYHGLGDTIQFIRYAPLLGEAAAHVTVWAQPALIPLIATVPGIDAILPLHDGLCEADYDVDVEVMELAHVFRSTLDTIPRDVPYLHADPAPIERDGRLAVGLVWRAGDWDERRSIPFPLIARLADVPGVDLHVLQRGEGLAECGAAFGTHSGSDDVTQCARVMRGLDLVVTVDSMPAHLAGALGVPAWTLLHADADWRWMDDRDDSPWYPTMRLFRQQTPGDWRTVIDRVAAELAAEVRRRSAVERDSALPLVSTS